MKKARVIFFGTPDFAVPALEALVKAGYEIVAVVTQPDKPVGRGLKMEAPAVKVKAQELGLMVLQPAALNVVGPGLVPGRGGVQDPALQRLKTLNPDLGVCVAYGKIIPKAVLDLFPRGVLNIHPSLLPKYRGPSPIQTAIRNGDEETGVTIMLLDEEMDHGPILSCSVYPVACNATGGELSKLLAQEGAKLLIKTIPQWLNRTVEPLKQDHSRATFTKMLEREDGRIDWSKPAEQIERMIRGYNLWPGTFTTWNGKRLKILRVSLLHPTIGCANNSTAGYVWRTDDDRLAVNCNPGSIILETLQPEGKKEMTGEDFLRGSPKFLGSILS